MGDLIVFPLDRTTNISSATKLFKQVQLYNISPEARLCEKLFQAIILTDYSSLDKIFEDFDECLIRDVANSENFLELINSFLLEDVSYNKNVKGFYKTFKEHLFK